MNEDLIFSGSRTEQLAASVHTKRCPHCRTVKIEDEFYPRNRKRTSWCKDCTKALAKAKRARRKLSTMARKR